MTPSDRDGSSKERATFQYKHIDAHSFLYQLSVGTFTINN